MLLFVPHIVLVLLLVRVRFFGWGHSGWQERKGALPQTSDEYHKLANAKKMDLVHMGCWGFNSSRGSVLEATSSVRGYMLSDLHSCRSSSVIFFGFGEGNLAGNLAGILWIFSDPQIKG